MAVVDDFLAQYPRSTQSTYEQVLREFSQITQNIDYATPSEILDYQRRINGQSPATVSRKLATLSSFYAYLQRTNLRPDDPTVGVRRPRVDAVRSITWLTNDETQRLLQSVAHDPRSLALVWAGLHSLRVGELVGLDVEDYREGALTVTGKGNKTRLIPLIESAQRAFENYIGRRKSGPMFLGPHNRRLSRRSIERIISGLSEQVGRRLYPHALRHTFGTTAIKSGNSTLAVQKVMGHSSPSTTEKYVHLDTADSRITVERTYEAIKTPLVIVSGGKENVG